MSDQWRQDNSEGKQGVRKPDRKSKRKSKIKDDDFSRKEIKQKKRNRQEKLSLIRMEEMAEFDELVEV